MRWTLYPPPFKKQREVLAVGRGGAGRSEAADGHDAGIDDSAVVRQVA